MRQVDKEHKNDGVGEEKTDYRLKEDGGGRKVDNTRKDDSASGTHSRSSR